MNTYSIQDLCDQTGVTRRTVYFYIQQGILPPPAGAGVSTAYSDAHLVRLKLIPLLRSQGLRLDDIRKYFQTASIEDLKQKLAKTPVQAAVRAPFVPKAETLLAYQLPAGIQLLVPAVLSTPDRRKVEQLLEFTRTLFSDLPNTPIEGGIHHV